MDHMEPVTTLAEAAKCASSRIVSIAAETTRSSSDSSVFDEVQETILALIAAVISADGATTHHEFVFASLIAKGLQDPLRCRAYLTEYAEKWKTIAAKTPRFLEKVVEYDGTHRTTYSRDILTELRELVRCAALVDGEPLKSEADVADALLTRVDALFRQARWSVRWEESPYPLTPPPTALNRSEFRNREIV